jgi:hypothetical protein
MCYDFYATVEDITHFTNRRSFSFYGGGRILNGGGRLSGGARLPNQTNPTQHI